MRFFVSTSMSKKTKTSLKESIRAYAGYAVKLIAGKNTTLPILAGDLKGKKWVIGAGIAPVLGMWKEPYTDKFEESIYESSVVYDIGAQVGWYTLLSSELVGQVGKVVAFEPLPSVLRYLTKHVEANHCTNVQIMEAAVSDRDGTATFFANVNVGLGSLSPIYGSKSTTKMVKTVKIDSIIKKKITPVPNFIKMDIEGGELAALKGAKSTLVEHGPAIFLETHGYDMCMDCCNLLTSFGYNLERFHWAGAGRVLNWQLLAHSSRSKLVEKRMES